jgi:hypothetical protein
MNTADGDALTRAGAGVSLAGDGTFADAVAHALSAMVIRTTFDFATLIGLSSSQNGRYPYLP